MHTLYPQTTHSGHVSFFSKSASTNSSGYFAFSGQRSFNGLTFFSFARLRTVPRTIYLPDSTSSLTICIATKPEAPVTRTRDMFLVVVYENVPENLSSTVLPVHEMLGEPRKLKGLCQLESIRSEVMQITCNCQNSIVFNAWLSPCALWGYANYFQLSKFYCF